MDLTISTFRIFRIKIVILCLHIKSEEVYHCWHKFVNLNFQ